MFGFQGCLKSSMLVPPENTSAVLVMTSSKSVSICNRSHARRVNSGKITISLMLSFERNLLVQQHDIRSQELETLRYHGVKTRSLFHFGLVRYRDVTSGQTDGRTDGRTELR